MGLGIGSKQALQILKKGFDNVSGIVLQAVPPKKVTIEQILDPIEKDLEVLEIIKKNTKLLDYGEREIFGGELYILQGFRITNREEYQKIKEWIDK